MTSFQPELRVRALAASAGEAGKVGEATFFNRAAEKTSLATRLADLPKAVLVVTGPPSSGKSGVRATGFCA